VLVPESGTRPYGPSIAWIGDRYFVSYTSAVRTPSGSVGEAAIQAVVRRARAADVTVYYVGYGWVAKTRMLERVSAQTGGVYLAAGRERKITEAFDAIARALDAQYTLGYVPRPGLPGEWRPIAVEVARTSTVKVAARKGYLVPAAAGFVRP